MAFVWTFCACVASSAPPLEFGDVEVGTIGLESLWHGNAGEQGVVIAEVPIDGAPVFDLAFWEGPFFIPANDEVEVVLAFAPEVAGDYTGGVRFIDGRGNETCTLLLEGSGICSSEGCVPGDSVADIEVEPAWLDLEPGGQEFVTIRNVGDADLRLASIELQQGDGSFGIGPVGSVLLATGAETEFVVTSAGDAPVGASDIVEIRSDDLDAEAAEVAVEVVAR